MDSPLDAARLAAAAALAAGSGAPDGTVATWLPAICALVDAARGVVFVHDAPHEHAHTTWGEATADTADTVALRLPLMAGEQAVGTLEVARAAARPFTDADRLLLTLVTPRLAFAIERQRLLEAESAARRAAADAVALLRQQEERFEAMVDGAVEFIGLTRLDGSVLEVNRAALALVGTTRAAVVDRPFWDTPWWAHDPAQRERLRTAMVAAAGGTDGGFEATHVAADGRLVIVDFSVRAVRDRMDLLTFLVVEGTDVTVRTRERAELSRSRDELAARVSAQAGRLARAQDALEETQALHRAVVETIVDGIVVIDQTGIMEWTNRATQQMFGYDAADLIGRNVSMLMPAGDSAGHDAYLRRYLSTGERRIIGIGREVRGRRKDGREFPLYLAVGETTVNEDRKFTGIVRDLSETKRLEQLLQERQTLARIGELAAVVAHEVRNPLAAIRGVVEVIQTRFDEGTSERKVLGDLLTRVDSLDHLVGDLLVYARPAPPVFRRAWVLALVRDTATLVANDPAATPMRIEITGDDVELWLDPAQMGRAVLNLMTNAAQAMRPQGVVRVSGAKVGDRYQVTFADDGPGMPADVMERCLEPFFTTKTRGTGLGLPIAKRVVDEHGGSFAIATAPGAGTKVTIELPMMPTDAD